MLAVARKVTVAPSVDFAEIAKMTEGFSGADLQALIYNAQLEVIHAAIATDPASGKQDTHRRDETPVKYVIIGGQPDQNVVTSKAEESAMQRRVSRFILLSLIGN